AIAIVVVDEVGALRALQARIRLALVDLVLAELALEAGAGTIAGVGVVAIGVAGGAIVALMIFTGPSVGAATAAAGRAVAARRAVAAGRTAATAVGAAATTRSATAAAGIATHARRSAGAVRRAVGAAHVRRRELALPRRTGERSRHGCA